MTDPRRGICAIMMLKNENRFILHENGDKPNPPYTMLEQNIRRLQQLVEEIYIVDNSSEDDSLELYKKYHENEGIVKYIQINPKEYKFDDVRDRRVLLEVAKRRGMKWVLVVDGDEIYEERATEWIHKFCHEKNYDHHFVVKFHYINFWRSRTRYRTDMWSSSWFPRLFSITDLVLQGTQLHNYSFGFRLGSSFNQGQLIQAPVKCLHYGWASWEHRVKKTQRYIERDMEINHRSYEHTKQVYAADLDERGLEVAVADPQWGEEFRTGFINY